MKEERSGDGYRETSREVKEQSIFKQIFYTIDREIKYRNMESESMFLAIYRKNNGSYIDIEFLERDWS